MEKMLSSVLDLLVPNGRETWESGGQDCTVGCMTEECFESLCTVSQYTYLNKHFPLFSFSTDICSAHVFSLPCIYICSALDSVL